ncbi:MAG: M23 family metallopeptidase [Chitinophagaceae bacterium]|nr:M23 family metallopeptidase [Chitinophagaceae bacterium]
MKTRLFKTYRNGIPIYDYIQLFTWPFVMPCKSTTQDIRDTYHCYVWRNGRCHKGIDFIGYAGSPIYSIGQGTVIDLGYDWIYGNYIDMFYGNNSGYRILARYAHLADISVKLNQKIKKGGKIGLMGTTGDSDSNHLHFEIKIVGINELTRKLLPFDYAKAVDPIPFLPQKEIQARYGNHWQNERLPNDLGL